MKNILLQRYWVISALIIIVLFFLSPALQAKGVDASLMTSADSSVTDYFYKKVTGSYGDDCLAFSKFNGPMGLTSPIVAKPSGIIRGDDIALNIFNRAATWMFSVMYDSPSTSFIATVPDPKGEITATVLFKGKDPTNATIATKDDTIKVCKGKSKNLKLDLWAETTTRLAPKAAQLSCTETPGDKKFMGHFAFGPDGLTLDDHKIKALTPRASESLSYADSLFTYAVTYPDKKDIIFVNMRSDNSVPSLHWQLPNQTMLNCDVVPVSGTPSP